MDRRDWLRAIGGAALAVPAGAWANGRTGPGSERDDTLRVAFGFAETGFDPPAVSDQASVTVLSHIFESPLTYARLARPAVLVPCTAAALPEVSDDHRRFVVTLRPGILFADDPAFGGRPRELVAADYVYTIKRFYDPTVRTEHLYQFENAKILGLSELRRRVIAAKAPFPYDEPVEGLRALDRYRFEVRLAEPDPRFPHVLAAPGWTGAVAREVVERYGADLPAHPVGTGPYRLASWRRASRIVLERNPRFRGEAPEAAPPDADAATVAAARALAGTTLPVIPRIEIAIVTESQPRWLAFLGGQLDAVGVPPDLAAAALPGGTLAPHLARRGITAQRQVTAAITHTYFNLDDPVIGGLDAPRVALRRAVAMALDTAEEIRLARGGQAVPARTMLPPHVTGHDPGIVTEVGRGDAGRAAALLETWGWHDRDGDGWRERPDGTPLTLRLASTEDRTARQLNELWRKRLAAVGVRIVFEPAPFGELIKRALAGELQMWGFSWAAGNPDGDFFLGLAYGPNAGQSNDARFRLPAFDRLYERQRRLPDGPERLATMREATRLMLAYMPYIPHVHPVQTDLAHPWLVAPPRHPFRRDHWTAWKLRPSAG